MKNHYQILFHGTDDNRWESPVVIADCPSYREAQKHLTRLLENTRMILSFRGTDGIEEGN